MGGKLRLFFLPGYAPELNPDEQVWNEVKYRRVGRRSPRTKEQLRTLLHSSLFALQRLPKLIRSFFNYRAPAMPLVNNSTYFRED